MYFEEKEVENYFDCNTGFGSPFASSTPLPRNHSGSLKSVPKMLNTIQNERKSNWEKIFSKYSDLQSQAVAENDLALLEEFEVDDDDDWIWEPEGFRSTEFTNDAFKRLLRRKEMNEDVQTALTRPGQEAKEFDIVDMEDLEDTAKKDQMDWEKQDKIFHQMNALKKMMKNGEEISTLKNEVKVKKRGPGRPRKDEQRSTLNNDCSKSQVKSKVKRNVVKAEVKMDDDDKIAKVNRTKVKRNIVKTEVKGDDEAVKVKREAEVGDLAAGEVQLDHLHCTSCFKASDLPSIYWTNRKEAFKCLSCLTEALGHSNDCQMNPCNVCLNLAKVFEKRRKVAEAFLAGNLLMDQSILQNS